MNTGKPKVLCVDDEPQVLEGLALHLHRAYEVVTATSGASAIEILTNQGPFAVILSDMRMPGMDGAAFLSRARQAVPDTVRMLLTGHADMQSAIAAVNDGQIFRFLMKPCPPDRLRLAFEAAAEQYRLVTAERVLLAQTLRGSIKILVDILSLTSPVAFGRAARIRQLVRELAKAHGIKERWPIEIAALLSQLGSITVPEDVLKRRHLGEPLSPHEQEMIAQIPRVTEDLLGNLPRLESVREILSRRSDTFTRDGKNGRMNEELRVGARILRIAEDFDELESQGYTVQTALDTMRGREQRYDPRILELFIQIRGDFDTRQEIREVPLRSLVEGMVFAEDVRSRSGLLVVARGFQVTSSFIERARNFGEGYVNEPVRVIVKPSDPNNDSPSSGQPAQDIE